MFIASERRTRLLVGEGEVDLSASVLASRASQDDLGIEVTCEEK